MGRAHSRLGSWVLASLAAAALLLAVAAAWRAREQARPIEVTVSTGGIQGLRHRLIESLAAHGDEHDLVIHPKVIVGIDETIRELEDRTVDFSMIQGGLDLSRHQDLRLAATLDVEPLHVLVKEELYDDVSKNLLALKGKRIGQGGVVDTLGRRLANEVLQFAGLHPPTESSAGDFQWAEPVAQREVRDRDHMPDAIFAVSAMPSATVKRLVINRNYRLVALRFAHAFSLAAVVDAERRPASDTGHPLLKEHLTEMTIPAFTYRVHPPEPAEDIPTLSTRALLLTHRDTSPVAVERMLDAIYSNRIVRAVEPPLSPQDAALAKDLPLHAGTLSYLDRDKPILSAELVGLAANTVAIAVPTLGAVLCFWQWLRTRAQARNQANFETYLQKITDLEMAAMELETNRTDDVEAVTQLRLDLGRLKAEVVQLFCRDELTDADLMSNFLIQLNDTRTYISSLLQSERSAAGGAASTDRHEEAAGGMLSAAQPPQARGHN